MDSSSTPLFSRLLDHCASDPKQFHIPGHKGGRGTDPEFSHIMGRDALAIDLVNIAPLDDLHEPRGVILEAEQLAAMAFGAQQTFFSVQGTSTAIMAMIMSTCSPGDKIVVPRNAHRSVVSALVLTGAVPVFVQPELDPTLGIAHGVSLQTIRTTLDQHKDVKAVLLVRPTYFGVCMDLAPVVALAHSKGVAVLVDEAHGAHLYFHEALPPSAMACGADAAATSMHKLCGSLTQSSVLNLQGSMISPRRMRQSLSLLTTTSTSYLLLASLDTARRHMAVRGRDALDRALALASLAREAINRLPNLSCFRPDDIGRRSSSWCMDPTKLCIEVSATGLTGLAVERILRQEYQIEVELSDLRNVLCIISIADDEERVMYLVNALRSIAARCPTIVSPPPRPTCPPEHRLAMTPREAVFSPSESIPLAHTVGRVAAELVTVYPPGIAWLIPGEIVTSADVACIQRHKAMGLSFQGPEDNALDLLRVVMDEKR